MTKAVLLALCLATPAAAAVPAPTMAVGDAWVFDQTIERGAAGFARTRLDETVERLEDGTMTVGIKRDGAPTSPEDHLVGQDWSQRHLADGQQTITTRPFSFPLHPGKTWSIDYTDTQRRGNQLANHVRRTYRVTGWEDVTVPAGTFHAMKIVANGADEAEVIVPGVALAGAAIEPGATAGFTRTQRGGRGRLTRVTYAEFYYVPELHYYAKSIEEQSNNDNVRVSRTTFELVSYRLADRR